MSLSLFGTERAQSQGLLVLFVFHCVLFIQFSGSVVEPLPLFPELFHPKQKLYPFSSNYPSSQPLITSILLSVTMDLPILDISYKWNHTIFILLCLAYFT